MTPLHKRVPASMAREYVAMGWEIESKTGRIVTLVWRKQGSPP